MQQPRQQSSPSYHDTYQAATVADAARILRVSESTIRRLVRTGKLEAERVERPQGHAWLVKIPAAATDQSGTSHHLGATTPVEQPDAGALSAWTASVLEPLVLELRLSRETIAGQAERLGYVSAERDAALAELAALRTAQASPGSVRGPEPVPQPDPFPQPIPPAPNAVGWWRRWWLALAGVGLVAIVTSASCQPAASVKHAGLCSSARASMDYWSNALAGRPAPSTDQWNPIRGAVDVAEKVC